MVIPRLIERKRDGDALRPEEWRELIVSYVAGEVPDYQMAALAMAVVFRGLNSDELAALTDAMRDSGATLPRSAGGPPRIDKHSTGGVGDTTSLVLAPLLASCGVAVPMMSGRGLGHTGGTLDKLESIPGFRTELSLDEAARQLDRIGVVMFGQTDQIAPADRRLYALRDVTGTVPSSGLIAASIMSKKLAEGLDGLVLDIKVGPGAFLTTTAAARELAATMMQLGRRAGCPTVARLTAMDRPLGAAIGNALEVRQAIAALRGEQDGALMDVTRALAADMLRLAGRASTESEADALLSAAIESGRAIETFGALIAAQGGDPAVLDTPDLLPRAAVEFVVPAGRAGIMPALPPRELGEVVVDLGGGRAERDAAIDPAVGLVIAAPVGVAVEPDDEVIRIHARSGPQAQRAAARLRTLIAAAWDAPLAPLPLLIERIADPPLAPRPGVYS